MEAATSRATPRESHASKPRGRDWSETLSPKLQPQTGCIVHAGDEAGDEHNEERAPELTQKAGRGGWLLLAGSGPEASMAQTWWCLEINKRLFTRVLERLDRGLCSLIECCRASLVGVCCCWVLMIRIFHSGGTCGYRIVETCTCTSNLCIRTTGTQKRAINKPLRYARQGRTPNWTRSEFHANQLTPNILKPDPEPILRSSEPREESQHPEARPEK